MLTFCMRTPRIDISTRLMAKLKSFLREARATPLSPTHILGRFLGHCGGVFTIVVASLYRSRATRGTLITAARLGLLCDGMYLFTGTRRRRHRHNAASFEGGETLLQATAAVIQFEFDRCLHSALLDHLLALQVQTNLSDDNGPGVCFSFAVR